MWQENSKEKKKTEKVLLRVEADKSDKKKGRFHSLSTCVFAYFMLDEFSTFFRELFSSWNSFFELVAIEKEALIDDFLSVDWTGNIDVFSVILISVLM